MLEAIIGFLALYIILSLIVAYDIKQAIEVEDIYEYVGWIEFIAMAIIWPRWAYFGIRELIKDQKRRKELAASKRNVQRPGKSHSS